MHNYHHQLPSQSYQSGLLGVFGGVISLTTATLYGGASIVRTIVEGSVWQAEHPQYGCSYCQPECHVCYCHCLPEAHHCCCGCC